MKKYGLIVGLFLSLLSIGVYAANITNATYSGTVRVSNNGTATTNQSVSFTLNSTSLISAGFVNASLNNTAILNNNGIDNAFMPGIEGNPWITWVNNISGPNQNLDYTLYMGGNQSMSSNLTYFPGATGMAVADNLSIRIESGNYSIEQRAYVDTTAGTNKTITLLPNYFNTTITSGGVISSSVNLTGALLSVNASGVTSGEHLIRTTAVGSNISIYVDGVLKDTAVMSTNITYFTNPVWLFGSLNTTPFIYYSAVTINGTLAANWTWQYGTTFADLTGKGHTATPTFRTSGTSANVTANLTGISPVSQTTSDPTSPTVVAGNITSSFVDPPNLYTELTITAPFAAFINNLLDGANIPRALFWFPYLFGITGLVGFATAWLTKSLMIQGVVMGFLLILFSLMGGFGYWVCIEFIVLALAVIIGSKQYGL